MSSSRYPVAMSRITGTAVSAAAACTLVLRAFGTSLQWGVQPAWLTALGIFLALLAVRIAVLMAAVRRGELPWSRLLLPGIFLVEGLGVWWGDGGPAWQSVRLATAVALELALVVLAIHHLWREPRSHELSEDRLARPLGHLLPTRAARLIAVELTMLALAVRQLLGGWRTPAPSGFTYHRDAV